MHKNSRRFQTRPFLILKFDFPGFGFVSDFDIRISDFF